MPSVSGRRIGHGFNDTGTPFKTSGGFTWVLAPEEAFGSLASVYTEQLHRGALAIAQRWKPEITNWMKDNAPWTDRTGNARQTLHTEIDDIPMTMVRLLLAHGVDYGLFLEVKNGGRYAIVNPAIDEFGPKIWADVKRMMGR